MVPSSCAGSEIDMRDPSKDTHKQVMRCRRHTLSDVVGEKYGPKTA